MGLGKNFLVKELLQKSKLRWFIIEIGGERNMNICPEFMKMEDRCDRCPLNRLM